MRIAFLGTPEFALPSLQSLIDTGYELCVFTQPDRPVGRNKMLTMPPVKMLAREYGLPVFQFERIKSPEGAAALEAWKPELMVTAAFGQLLSQRNLDVPKYGCINVHGSLLPKYRGAAPIQWAIINGERVTGVTTMLTELGLDSGDILMQSSLAILPDETAGELTERLSMLGARLLMKTIRALEAGSLTRTKQNEAESTRCAMLKKEDGRIDWNWNAQRVHDRVRGTSPWPGAYAMLGNETLKIWRTALVKTGDYTLRPGECAGSDKEGLFVGTADGALEIKQVQGVGGKRMDARDYLRGKPLAGKVLT